MLLVSPRSKYCSHNKFTVESIEMSKGSGHWAGSLGAAQSIKQKNKWLDLKVIKRSLGQN